MAKYESLHDHLVRSSGPVEMSFEDINRLVGGLPPSAYHWRAWWANDAHHVQSKAWLGCGRRVESVNLVGQRVTFSARPR